MLTIVLGLLLAFLYHIFYILSKTTKLNKIIKGIFDIIYWSLFALILFLVMLKFNSGEVRPFAILGSILGMIIYYAAIKNIMDTLIFYIFKYIKIIFLLLLTIISTPFKLVLYPFFKIYNTIAFF